MPPKHNIVRIGSKWSLPLHLSKRNGSRANFGPALDLEPNAKFGDLGVRCRCPLRVNDASKLECCSSCGSFRTLVWLTSTLGIELCQPSPWSRRCKRRRGSMYRLSIPVYTSCTIDCNACLLLCFSIAWIFTCLRCSQAHRSMTYESSPFRFLGRSFLSVRRHGCSIVPVEREHHLRFWVIALVSRFVARNANSFRWCPLCIFFASLVLEWDRSRSFFRIVPLSFSIESRLYEGSNPFEPERDTEPAGVERETTVPWHVVSPPFLEGTVSMEPKGTKGTNETVLV